MTVKGVQNSAFPPDLRVLNIDGFAQKITMKMNQASRQRDRDQHGGGNALESAAGVLHQENIDAFMGPGPFFPFSPPEVFIVEQHPRLEEEMGYPAQLVAIHETPEK